VDECKPLRSGGMQMSELGALLRKLMPASTAADLRFFQMLLDADTDGRITYEVGRCRLTLSNPR
jgi:hypothetical protein